MMPISQGEEVRDQLSQIYAGDVARPNYVYQFEVMVAGEDFSGKPPLWQEIAKTLALALALFWNAQKKLLSETMDSYDMTDPYGRSLWWAADGEQVTVQIANTQSRAIDRIWDILFGVFERKFAENTISIIRAFEGPIIPPERREKGRQSWWDKFVDWLRSLGIPIQEHQVFIKTAIILGGVTTSLYFLSSIAKKIPRRIAK